MEMIIGTAGHIDHGKTALVRALTGIDADRLPEEKLRGITIDIGFAELAIGDTHFGFVDVPGHEKFIKNMLAGASGIDLVLLVIAADEGVMPQTREHFDICRLLGLRHGIVVLTKTDLVDPETLDLARIDAAELVAGSFLQNAPVVPVSAVNGDGVEVLKTELRKVSAKAGSRNNDRVAFLPIDRSFSVKGFGTVVTGTIASGSISNGSELELMPASRRVRVRGLQTHGREVNAASAGQRTAINLAGIDHAELTRGMSLSEPGVLRATQIIDAAIDVLKDAVRPLRSRQRVRLHIGTAEVLARVLVLNESGEIAAGSSGFAQLRLEVPTVCSMGDRFIVRSYSPQRTIGGGGVILPHAEKHRRRDISGLVTYLGELANAMAEKADVVRLLAAAGNKNELAVADLRAQTGWQRQATSEAIKEAIANGETIDAGGVLLPTVKFEEVLAKITAAVEDFHKREPLAAGITKEMLRDRVGRRLRTETFESVLDRLAATAFLVIEKGLVRTAKHKTKLSVPEQAFIERLLTEYRGARLEPPKTEEILAHAAKDISPSDARKLLQKSVESGDLVKLTNEYYIAKASIDALIDEIRKQANSSTARVIDVAKFKEIAGVSRKYAIPLLEFLDREKVTVRAGDRRVVLQ